MTHCELVIWGALISVFSWVSLCGAIALFADPESYRDWEIAYRALLYSGVLEEAEEVGLDTDYMRSTLKLMRPIRITFMVLHIFLGLGIVVCVFAVP